MSNFDSLSLTEMVEVLSVAPLGDKYHPAVAQEFVAVTNFWGARKECMRSLEIVSSGWPLGSRWSHKSDNQLARTPYRPDQVPTLELVSLVDGGRRSPARHW
jgi:hypothetical protein